MRAGERAGEDRHGLAESRRRGGDETAIGGEAVGEVADQHIDFADHRLGAEDTEAAIAEGGKILGDIHQQGGAESAATGPQAGDIRHLCRERREGGHRHQDAAGAEGLRVFTELAESSAGRVIRTGRYDVTPQGLFALQDRIADDLVGVVAPAVKAHELARAKRKPPESITAYDLMLQGVELQYALEETSFAEAGTRLYEAIARDPGYAPAYAHVATWHNFRIGQGWSAYPAEDAAHAARCAAKALELDRNNAVALAIQGQVLSFNGRDYAVARQYLDRAIAVGPSSVLAWTLSSATHGWTGNGALGIEHAARALKLSPFDPFVFFAEHMLSQSHYVQGDYATAIELARSVERRNPRLTSNLRTLTAALVGGGAIEAAREVAAAMLSREPGFRVSAFERRTPLCDAVRADYVARLRRAGLPD